MLFRSDITFTGKDNQPHYPHQTSWGVSTRMIGGIIMTHGDDNGLVLPPRIAPTQAVVIPVAAHKPGVLAAAASLRDRLNAAGVRSKMDDSDNSPGWKFAEYEMKGVPSGRGRRCCGPADSAVLPPSGRGNRCGMNCDLLFRGKLAIINPFQPHSSPNGMT